MSRECCGPDEPQETEASGRRHAAEPAPLNLLPLGGTAAPAGQSTHRDDDDDCCAPKVSVPGEQLVYEELQPWWLDRALLLPAIAGVLLAAGFVSGRSGAPDGVALLLETGALLAGAWTFVPGALRRLRRGKLGVGLLMTIAAVGAVALGRIGEAAALAFLFSIAEALEERAMDRAQHGLRALLALIPDTARVRRPAGDETVRAADLQRGDLLVVGAGERISTDGVVEDGRSNLDTSAVTGESIPVEVGVGDDALAGSVNGSGTILVRATANGQDNSLTQIVRLVEEAHAKKGDRARLADRIARPLVPAILLLGAAVALGGLFTDQPGLWLERALVVLVAASPCALAIAVPVTVISAIGSASKLGVIIKSGQAFEQLGTIKTVAFDKTGTLTRNQPEVVEVHTVSDVTRETALALAAALEATSTHPLAEAVVAAAPTRPDALHVEEHAGRGLSGHVDGSVIRVGSDRWVPTAALSAPAESMAERGMSIVLVERDAVTIGVIGIRDELKPEAAETIDLLRRQGVATMMLTGDNSRTAHALAQQVGIDDVRAEQMPADKADAISRATTSAPTAMVGDGINDAPALAAATVGIAMGVTGSAAAVESADVAFTGNDLRLIPHALENARRGRRIMTGNIGLSLAIIVVLVPLALFGILGLAEVVLVHELAEVVVILNGVRAARVRSRVDAPVLERDLQLA